MFGLSALLIVLLALPALHHSVTYAREQAEIAKLFINEQDFDVTEDIHLYHTHRAAVIDTMKYVRIPRAQLGDVLYQGYIVETFAQKAARIEFTAEQLLFLGAGTEWDLACTHVMRGESCAMARFEGFQNQKPFVYLKKGAAWLKNIVACDNRACFDTVGTEYYIHHTQAKTTVAVLHGAVQVRPRNVARDVLVRQGEYVDIVSANTAPTQPVRMSRTMLDPIYAWIRSGIMVIQTPVNGAITQRVSVPLTGTVSEESAQDVVVLHEKRVIARLPVTKGQFTTTVRLHEGTNRLTVEAVTRYGKVVEALSITKISAPSTAEHVPDIRGKTERAALTMLAIKGFDYVTVTHQTTSRGRVGTVVRQDPKPHDTVPLSQTIALVVEDDRLVDVPDVQGRSPDEASRLLQERGLTVGTITKRSSGEGAVGTVIQQSFAPDRKVPPQSRVDLVVKAAEITAKEAIERIRNQDHQKLPQPSTKQLEGTHSGKTTVQIQNNTGKSLHLYFSGPEERTVTVPKDQTIELELMAGRYEIAAHVPDPNIKSLYDQHTYASNTQSSYMFYIQRGLR